MNARDGARRRLPLAARGGFASDHSSAQHPSRRPGGRPKCALAQRPGRASAVLFGGHDRGGSGGGPVLAAQKHGAPDIPERPRQRIRFPEVRGEFLVDFEGPPIADVPLLKRLPELESLLTANREHGAVAAGMQPDIALAVELEFMPAGEVTKPAALHLEIAGAGPQRHDHWADVQVSHFQPPQRKGPSPPRRARPTTRIT